MREAGNYHIEQSAYWNRFGQGGRPVVTNRVSVTSGPSETTAAKAYRIAPVTTSLPSYGTRLGTIRKRRRRSWPRRNWRGKSWRA